MSSNLAKREEGAALVRLEPQQLLQSAVENGAGIETLERLVALAKDVKAEQAREAWHDAMAEFQRTCPRIKKTMAARVSTKTGGSYTYRYAPLEDILATILPVMGPLGLSVSWRTRFEGDEAIANCRVSHTFGHHEESGDVRIPIQTDNAGVGATPPQRAGISLTYAKRYALLAIVGLAPEDDPDAQEAPAPTVQPPRRASETKASPTESPGEGASLVYEGPILAVKEAANGTKKDGTPWTLYAIAGKDWEGVAFSSTVADMARSLVGNGVETKITYHVETSKSGKASNKIDEIEDPVPM